MAGKLSTYATLAANGIGVGDLFPMVDVSAAVNKNILAETLIEAGARAAQANSSGIVQYDGTTLTFTATNVAVAGTFKVTSASATGFAVGRQGTTNPGLALDLSVGSCVTGLKITPAAAAAGLAVLVTSTATDENLTIDAKGAGTINLNTTGTGNIGLKRSTDVTGALTVTATNIAALAVGRQGATNPGLLVDSSNASGVTGVKIVPRIAASGVGIVVISSGTDESLTIDAKGAGTIDLNATGTGNIIIRRSMQVVSGGLIVDANGNELLRWPTTVASAINDITVTNAAIGAAPSLSATGDDAAIDLALKGKGTGAILLNTSGGTGAVKVGQPLQFPTSGIIQDVNANELIKFPATVGAAVNEITVSNVATGGTPKIKSTGSDTNVTLELNAQGSGTVQVTAPLLDTRPVTATADTATLTAAQLLAKYLDSVPTAAANYTLPTAAALVAAIPGAKVNDSFEFTIDNRSAGAFTITVLTNTGVTLRGTVTVAQNVLRKFIVVITNVTPSSEAYKCGGY